MGGGGEKVKFQHYELRKKVVLSFQNLEVAFNKDGRAPGAPLYRSATAKIVPYSLLVKFVEWFLANIFVTGCHSHMHVGFSALDSESKL